MCDYQNQESKTSRRRLNKKQETGYVSSPWAYRESQPEMLHHHTHPEAEAPKEILIACVAACAPVPFQNGKSAEENLHSFAEMCSSDRKDSPEPAGKKKTPMCLVNELARHHKFQPQYRLIEESGPAHKKTFVVNLKLGEEEYSACGPSIKKAQHAAAQLALENTSFQLPQPKPKMKQTPSSHNDKAITPTVELNALAMKLNLPPVYNNLPPVPISAGASPENGTLKNSSYSKSPTRSSRNGGDFRETQVTESGCPDTDYLTPPAGAVAKPPSPNVQRQYYNRFPSTPMLHRVCLSVGNVVVTGEGPSPQAARHHAARQALELLRQEIQKNEAKDTVLIDEADADLELKSPVSVCHELALKLSQPVDFVVISETGPPHMRNFVVQCKLGELSTMGEGNCKKLAKKKAAELMVEELKRNHPNGIVRLGETNLSNHQSHRAKTKPVIAKKKPRNLVKEVLPKCNGSGIDRMQDPISQLVQLQQSRKEKEPIFTVISERGIPRQPEFVVKVTVGSFEGTGIGTKKKDAKRAAALKALEALGVTCDNAREPADSPAEETMPRDADSGFVNGCQMLPGLLLIGGGSNGKRPTESSSSASAGVLDTKASGPTSNTNPPSKTSKGLRPEVRLRYLAQVLEFELEFSDFPKGKKGEFVSLVTLNTNPPQVSHGIGSTLEEAHDNAASNMLKLIAEGALDTCSQNSENPDEKA